MAERHTVDFDRVSFNVLSDEERGTITLQFDSPIWGHAGGHVKGLAAAIGRRYGGGWKSRLDRWLAGEGEPLLVAGPSGPHSENAEVYCLELWVKRGAKMESALADLVEFLRRQPGYRRLLGQPLDRDQMRERPAEPSSGDSSQAACDALKRIMELRRPRTGRRTTA
jgi:hypothetical protein